MGTTVDSIKVGDLVVLATPDGRLYRMRPSANGRETLFSSDDAPHADSSYPPEAMLVVLQSDCKRYFGFRSVAAEGKIMQAGKDLKMRAGNYNFKTWEHWQVEPSQVSRSVQASPAKAASGAAAAPPPTPLFSLTNRQFPLVRLNMRIERAVALPESSAKRLALMEFAGASAFDAQPEFPATPGGGTGGGKGEQEEEVKGVVAAESGDAIARALAEDDAVRAKEELAALREENRLLMERAVEAEKAAESAKFSADVAMKLAQECAEGRASGLVGGEATAASGAGAATADAASSEMKTASADLPGLGGMGGKVFERKLAKKFPASYVPGVGESEEPSGRMGSGMWADLVETETRLSAEAEAAAQKMAEEQLAALRAELEGKIDALQRELEEERVRADARVAAAMGAASGPAGMKLRKAAAAAAAGNGVSGEGQGTSALVSASSWGEGGGEWVGGEGEGTAAVTAAESLQGAREKQEEERRKEDETKKARIAELEEEVGRLSGEAVALREEAERLKGEEKKLIEEGERLRAEEKKLRGEEKKLKEEGEKLRGELAALTSREVEWKKAESKWKQVEEEGKKSQQQAAAVEEQLQRVQADLDAARQEKAALTTREVEWKKAESKWKQVEEEGKKSQQQAAAVEEQLQRVQADLDAARQEKAAAESKWAEEASEKDKAASKDAESSRRRIAGLEEEVARLQAEAEALKRRAEEMEQRELRWREEEQQRLHEAQKGSEAEERVKALECRRQELESQCVRQGHELAEVQARAAQLAEALEQQRMHAMESESRAEAAARSLEEAEGKAALAQQQVEGLSAQVAGRGGGGGTAGGVAGGTEGTAGAAGEGKRGAGGSASIAAAAAAAGGGKGKSAREVALEGQLAALRARGDESRRLRVKLNEAEARLQDAQSKHKQQLSAKEQLLASVQKELTGAKAQLATAEQEAAKIHALEAELARLRSLNSSLQKDLKQLRASASKQSQPAPGAAEAAPGKADTEDGDKGSAGEPAGVTAAGDAGEEQKRAKSGRRKSATKALPSSNGASAAADIAAATAAADAVTAAAEATAAATGTLSENAAAAAAAAPAPPSKPEVTVPSDQKQGVENGVLPSPSPAVAASVTTPTASSAAGRNGRLTKRGGALRRSSSVDAGKQGKKGQGAGSLARKGISGVDADAIAQIEAMIMDDSVTAKEMAGQLNSQRLTGLSSALINALPLPASLKREERTAQLVKLIAAFLMLVVMVLLALDAMDSLTAPLLHKPLENAVAEPVGDRVATANGAAMNGASDGEDHLDDVVVLRRSTGNLAGLGAASGGKGGKGGVGGGRAEEAAMLSGGHGGGGGGLWSAVFNLATTSVGAGIMALPATVKVLGLPLGLLLIALMGALTHSAVLIIVRLAAATNSPSYGHLMGTRFGERGRVLCEVMVMLQALGSLIVYLIISADVLSGTSEAGGMVHHVGLLEELAGGPTWWNGRAVVLLAVTTLVLLPLVLLRRIDSLMATSALSVGLAVLFVLFTAAAAVVRVVQGRLPPLRMVPDVSSWQSVLLIFTVVPVMTNAFICHYNVQPIYRELKDSPSCVAPAATMERAAGLAQVICTALYGTTALFAYLLFGDSTAADVLANYDQDLGLSQAMDDIVRVGYIVHLLLVFPIVHFPLRLTADILLFPKARLPLWRSQRRFFWLTAATMGFILACGVLVPDIYALFSLLGAIVAVSIGFTFPALLALLTPGLTFTCTERVAVWSMLVVGVAVSITGVASDVIVACQWLSRLHQPPSDPHLPSPNAPLFLQSSIPLAGVWPMRH
ncbi:unnamed protein product [Closterium sp. NIES-64]|nr:unnamed protein product [Closterium sp. NIES-64]